MIDALAVYKDATGEIEVEHLSNLSRDEAVELGSKIGALIGLGVLVAKRPAPVREEVTSGQELHAMESAKAGAVH